jgi:hypothetical protein
VKSEFAEIKPAFLKLTHRNERNDDEFLASIEESWTEFEAGKVLDAGDLLLFSEIMLDIAADGFVEEPLETVKQRILQLIGLLRINYECLPTLYDSPPIIRGFGIGRGKRKETDEIWDAVLGKLYEQIMEEGKEHQGEILDWVEKFPDTFSNSFIPLRNGSDPRYLTPEARYSLGPTLAEIDSAEFFKHLVKTPNPDKWKIFEVLKLRAGKPGFFYRELGFLRGLKAEIEKHLGSSRKRVPSFNILEKTGLKDIEEAIADLDRSTPPVGAASVKKNAGE